MKQFILHIATDVNIFINTQKANECTIYPWIHSNCNSLSNNDQLGPISFP
jgi:carnosine N-methyltransferase